MTTRLTTITYLLPLLLIVASVGCSGGTPEPTPEKTQVREETPVPTAIDATEEAVLSPAPVNVPAGLIREPVPEIAFETERYLVEAAHVPNDYFRLAREFLGVDTSSITTQEIGDYRVNDRAEFLIPEQPGSTKFKSMPSRLRYISEHVAWWAGINVRVDDTDIQALAERFENEVLPVNQRLFGKEWSPGIDGDERVHFLLVQEETWSIFGFFSDVNEYPKAIFPNSNEREMLVINLANSSIKNEDFNTKLAHEHQHLIHWNQDPNEDLWLNEAMGQLVTQVGGKVFGESNEIHFAQNPQIQLTSRPERIYGKEDKSSYAHYAAERLFSVYLLEQFGPEFINSLVHNPDPGVFSIEEELAKTDGAPTFNEVFANWLLANFLDMPDVMEGQFGYQNIETVDPIPQVINFTRDITYEGRVAPYGAHYYQVNSTDPIKLTFNGSTLTRLVPKDPATGSYAWYSNRGDGTTFSLRRSFDLSSVEEATLHYKVWYELDNYYDFAYLEISTDGENWTILETDHGTTEDPYDRSYGIGYTGSSVDWLDESIDLSPYAGQIIQIRFELITDFTTNRDGLQLDNIEIPEIGFFDGAEDDQAGWEAQGFIRSSNLVPVDWIVWTVTPGPSINRVEMSPEQSGVYALDGFGSEYNFALLVIAPTAPVSTLEINYEFILEH